MSRVSKLLLAVLCASLFIGACSKPQEKAQRYIESGKQFAAKKDYTRAILQFRNAIRAVPKDPEAHYQLALTYLEMGNYPTAISELQLVNQKLDPKHLGARLKLAELMASGSQQKNILEQSAALAEGVLSVSPENPDALQTLAITELKLGQPEVARKHLEEALAHAPSHLKSSVTLAAMKIQQGDMAGAEKALKEAVQKNRSTDSLVALGEFYRLVRKNNEAENQFQLAVQMDAKNGRALTDLGSVQYALGQKDQAEQTFKRMTDLSEPRYQYLYGLYLWETGKQKEAVAEFERVFKARPKDRVARTRLLAAYARLGRIDDVQRILTNALKENKRDVEALAQQAEFNLNTGKTREAENNLNQVLQYQPDSPIAHFLLSRVKRAEGQILAQRAELSDVLRLNPGMLQARVEFAQLLMEANDPQAALRTLDEAPKPQQKALMLVERRNWALLALDRRAELRKILTDALPAVQSDTLLLQKALLDLRDNKIDDARAAADKILQKSPGDVRALEVLGGTYVVQKQPNVALEKIRQHVEAHSNIPGMNSFLAKWERRYGNVDQARAAYLKEKEVSPQMVSVDISLAELDLLGGHVDAARQRMNGVLARDKNSAPALFLLGSIEYTAKNTDAAIANYRKALAITPNNVLLLNNLAFLLAETPDMADEALKYAQQAMQLQPESPAVLDTIGWVYYRKGIYRTAVDYLTNAVKKDSTPLRRYHLAMSYMKAGEEQKGRELLRSIAKLDPNLSETKLAQQALTQVKSQ